MAALSRVQVGNDGVVAASRSEIVLDVVFDGRRIWSFWLLRDGQDRDGASFVAWPGALKRFLHGTTTLGLVEHVTGDVLFEQEVTLGEAPEGTRISVVTSGGQPLGLDKSNRLSQTFDTRSDEHVAPLLDSIELVLGALKQAGVDAFPAYGTLLGAVRGGKLIGHDSDADLGYVSTYTHPVDVVRESFRLQRRLAEMGYQISRYSGAAFKIDVLEGDGMVRGLDVFGGFLQDGQLVLMGEIRAPFERDWIFPLGSTTLEGRRLPAPANTDKFLAATYGPSWRVPDPAFHFETPRSTHRRLNGWFRGTRVNRPEWDRTWSRPFRSGAASPNATPLARWLHEQEPDAALVVDVGCGRGSDIAWLARQGTPGVGLDFSPRGFAAVAQQVADERLPAEFHLCSLGELRHVLGWGAALARRPGPHVVLARHIAEATDRKGRHNLWRLCEMVLGGGGRLYLEFLAPGENGAGFARQNHLRMLDPERVVAELEARGGQVLNREERTVQRAGSACGEQSGEAVPNVQEAGQHPDGRRTFRMVVQWQA